MSREDEIRGLALSAPALSPAKFVPGFLFELLPPLLRPLPTDNPGNDATIFKIVTLEIIDCFISARDDIINVQTTRGPLIFIAIYVTSSYKVIV